MEFTGGTEENMETDTLVRFELLKNGLYLLLIQVMTNTFEIMKHSSAYKKSKEQPVI
jgi:hypothetical protein